MKRNRLKSETSFARRRFLVEGLEPRCMLAGNVNVFVSGGTLFVQGDSDDNAVVIQQEGNGIYSVTGIDYDAIGLSGQGFAAGATSINGDDSGLPLTFSGVKNDINVNLGDGNDGLGIGNNVEALNGLALDCFNIGFSPTDGGGTVTVAQVDGTLAVPRNLIVDLGAGNDFTAIDANVGTNRKGGLALINAGAGTNGVAFGSQEGLNSVGTLLISGGNGSDNVCVTGASVRNLLSVQIGDGDGEIAQQVHLNNVGAGQVLIITGQGTDNVQVSNVGIDRGLTIITGGGDDFLALNGFSAGAGDGPSQRNNGAGNVVIVTGDGNDQVSVNDFSVDSLTLDTGNGDDGIPTQMMDGQALQAIPLDGGIFIANGLVTRQLVVVTGNGDDFVTIENVSAHDIVVDTGAGNDGSFDAPIAIYNISVRGNVTLNTGAGNDFAYLHSGNSQISSIIGVLTVIMGGGNDNLEIIDQNIGKDLNVFLGDGNNNAGIGGALESTQVGLAEGTLNVRRNVTVIGGSNTDNVGFFNLAAHGDVFADLGAGDDNLLADGVTIGRNATILGGSGGDTVSLNFTNVGKTAVILMGAGDDTLNLSNSTARKLIARGGPGTDAFNNDLGITANGRTGNADVQEFEEFDLVPAV